MGACQHQLVQTLAQYRGGVSNQVPGAYGATAGSSNTGGGGGGNASTSYSGGNHSGGSGIVIVAYTT